MAGDNAAVTDENDNSKGAQDAASPTPMPPMAEKPGKKAPKGKEKEKKEKVKKVKKEKQAKPHPSSKAGPNFSIKITDDAKVEVMGVNKRAHALGSIADGDIITAIDGKDLTELPANIKVNDIRNLLLGCMSPPQTPLIKVAHLGFSSSLSLQSSRGCDVCQGSDLPIPGLAGPRFHCPSPGATSRSTTTYTSISCPSSSRSRAESQLPRARAPRSRSSWSTPTRGGSSFISPGRSSRCASS